MQGKVSDEDPGPLSPIPAGASGAGSDPQHGEPVLQRTANAIRRALRATQRRSDELGELCAPEFGYWRQRPWDCADYLRRLDVLNASNPELFVFDINGGRITVRDKMGPTAITQHVQQTRVPAYLEFFGHVVQTLGPELNLSFGMLLEDLASGSPEIPLLSFQKVAGDQLLLVPDIDTLILKFYDSKDFVDDLDHGAKRAAAVFVGSTTGVDPMTGRSATVTRDVVDKSPTPRIKAAKRFQDEADIHFKLPGLVQCDSTDTEAYLRSFEFASGGPISWKAQFAYRFIISVDGNGATCSRMALALRSQSVLLKYASPYVLYYTRALKPFVHYLPVADDEDVIRYVSVLRSAATNDPQPFSEIPENANAFYRRYLSRTAQLCYTAVLLNELQGLLRGQRIEGVQRRVDASCDSLDLMVHVGSLGDRWCWPSQRAGTLGSGEVIEAFCIRHNLPEASERDLECQCLWQDGSFGPWLPSGTLCGERGLCKPLAGLRLRTSGEFARRCAIRYRASFIGAPQTPWVEAGAWCASPDRLPLESLEIEAVPRGMRRALRKLKSAWAGAARGGAG
jgi:hypothetical protein